MKITRIHCNHCHNLCINKYKEIQLHSPRNALIKFIKKTKQNKTQKKKIKNNNINSISNIAKIIKKKENYSHSFK